MSEQQPAMHYVCTHEQARELVQAHDRFWVSNCGCREEQGCRHSRLDVCLIFNPSDPGSGSGKKEVSRAFVEGILQEAEARHLVTRPFRDETRQVTDGICFCCNECCGYFRDPAERCDVGSLIESTDLDACSQCDACTDVCFFGARQWVDGTLVLNRDKCYGCGLCRDVCTEEYIRMVER
jgi:Pyruvate/2-oxoacid:ferredoxin oxidoreductase delta subunit